MASHSSSLAWKIPWTEEPGGLQSMGLQRVRHDWETKHTHKQNASVSFADTGKLWNSVERQKNYNAVPLLSRIWLFATPWTIAHQATVSFTVSQGLLKFMSIESVMLSHPLLPSSLWPPIFPSIRVSINIYFVCTRLRLSLKITGQLDILFLLSIWKIETFFLGRTDKSLSSS